MLQPVEVFHEGCWVPATMLATRHDTDGWFGLVGWTDQVTRKGFHHWVAEEHLRAAPEVEPSGDAEPPSPAGDR
jgi:hypothetical protein